VASKKHILFQGVKKSKIIRQSVEYEVKFWKAWQLWTEKGEARNFYLNASKEEESPKKRKTPRQLEKAALAPNRLNFMCDNRQITKNQNTEEDDGRFQAVQRTKGGKRNR